RVQRRPDHCDAESRSAGGDGREPHGLPGVSHVFAHARRVDDRTLAVALRTDAGRDPAVVRVWDAPGGADNGGTARTRRLSPARHRGQVAPGTFASRVPAARAGIHILLWTL